jgi:hypothetical protein
MSRKHVKAVALMSERELGEHIELWHNDLWLASRAEHARDHRSPRQFHIHDPGRVKQVTRLKVQAADDMDADILFRHIQARHPELKYEKRVASLREEHDATHRLIPLVLDHYHEPATDSRPDAVPELKSR